METENNLAVEDEGELFLTSHQTDSSDDIRLELEKYLENCMNKLDSEGNKLLYYPSNFANIADTMNRDDLLLSDEDRPWSKYLLENSINSEIDKSLGHRYKNILLSDSTEESNKLDEEYRTIQLLDEKLKDLNKKNRKNNDNASTPRSTVSYNKDFTFLTRQKGSSSIYTSDKESERPESIPPSSPGIDDDNNNNLNDIIGNDENNDTYLNENRDDITNDQLTAILDNALANNSSNNKTFPLKKQRNMIKNNINKVKLNNNSSLSIEEEERLQNILENDLTADEMLFGFTTNDLEHLNKVNNDLNKFGNFDRLSNIEAKGLNGYDISELITTNNTTAHHVNDTYLRDHRIERLTKNYVKVIDSLIENSSLTIDDITSLYSNSNINNYTNNNITNHKPLLEIPNVEELNGYRKIKYDDIKNIISEIVNTNNENNIDCDNNNHNNTWKLYKKRQELDNLVSSIKPLVEQLNKLRSCDDIALNNSDDITTDNINMNIILSKIPSLPILPVSSRTSTPNTSRTYDETIFPPVESQYLPVPPSNEKCVV